MMRNRRVGEIKIVSLTWNEGSFARECPLWCGQFRSGLLNEAFIEDGNMHDEKCMIIMIVMILRDYLSLLFSTPRFTFANIVA